MKEWKNHHDSSVYTALNEQECVWTCVENKEVKEVAIWERRSDDPYDSCAAVVRLINMGYGLDVQVLDPRNDHAIERDDYPVFETRMRPVMLVGPGPEEVRALIQALVDWNNAGTFSEESRLRLVDE